MAKKCCDTCEFKFYGDDGICAGYGKISENENTYGKPIKEVKKIFPNGCEDWGISLEACIEEEKRKK